MNIRLPILCSFAGLLLGYQLASTRHQPAAPAPSSMAPVISIQPASPASPTVSAVAELEVAAEKNADLSRQLDEVRTQLAEREHQLARTSQNLEELRRPLTNDLLSSTVNARLKSGEAVVTGGYPLADGTRLYAFVRPIIETVDGEPMVKILGNLSLLDDATGRAVGLDSIATNATNTLQHGEVWIGDEVNAVLETLNSTPGTLGISMPAVTVRSSGTAVVKLDDSGLTLKLVPVLLDGGQDMDLEVRLEQIPPQMETPTDEASSPTASSAENPKDATAP